MFQSEFHYLNSSQVNLLLDKVKSNDKYYLISLFLLDTGVRISELLNLKINDIDFKEKFIFIKSLKKKVESVRKIPISERLYFRLIDYLSKNKQVVKDRLFNVTRQSVWAFYNNLSKKFYLLKNLHPHTFRHTFATNLVSSGVSIYTVKELLGHSNLSNTEIYSNIKDNVLKESIDKITVKKKWYNFIFKIFDFFKRNKTYRNVDFKGGCLVGRDKEILEITELINKNINVLILGSKGVGKSTLLNSISTNKKIIEIDDTTSFKSTLINILIHILETDKKELINFLYSDIDKSKIKNHFTKLSAINLCKELIKITEKHEYLIIIDDVTSITNSVVKCLEILNKHFVFLSSARVLKIDKSDFTSNFELVRIDKLKRYDIIQIIDYYSNSFKADIEDYEYYKNTILAKANLNPLFTIELIQRLSAERYINNNVLREIHHSKALKEIDFTPVLFLAFASLIVLRYLGREIGESSFQVIGGFALVFALFARQFFSRFKRRIL